MDIKNIDKEYYVYLLTNTHNNKTYLGITNNPGRRIRQHNGELSGGAKYTHSFKGEGEWVYYLHIKNLTKRESLSLERKVKNKRKKAKGNTPLERRLNVLIPTLKEFPFSQLHFF
tara:strand:- start:157 stop:501 length:345 start_codon:yes stop_codon:yes gene_type:complete